MRSLERLALVGALAAAVTISGTLNARVKDLAQQRDIYHFYPRPPRGGRPVESRELEKDLNKEINDILRTFVLAATVKDGDGG